jgi:FkbM family methyltransferase
MPYPDTGHSKINRIIVDEYFRDKEKGFFIETGSCDGIFQSNTYYLETELNWSGLLIEPNPDYAKECVINRPKSKVYECALVSFDFKKECTTLYSIAMKGAMGTIENRGMWINEKENFIVHDKISVRTLTSILDEVQPKEIDFLSLDVEGYELNVLMGIDFEKYKPKVIVVECHDDSINLIDNILFKYYNLDNKISNIDYVYVIK